MGWLTEEYGESHEGIVGAVLADGSEPKSVYIDVGSGANIHETRELWAYNGRLSRPKADSWRASCTCGWRGESYRIDWAELEGDRLDGLDTSAAYDDWWEHIETVERQTVPLPAELTDLLERLEDQLTALAEQAPVAALKTVATLERLTVRVGREAADAAQADELTWETIGKALGLTPAKARSRVTRYLFAR
ncbi:hypothetical protein OK074_1203 [Actinobacteria bacterium OK074]|nr:hypothetical protein OK074_1203 [Actinobacteria bacterium OK074]